METPTRRAFRRFLKSPSGKVGLVLALGLVLLGHPVARALEHLAGGEEGQEQKGKAPRLHGSMIALGPPGSLSFP